MLDQWEISTKRKEVLKTTRLTPFFRFGGSFLLGGPQIPWESGAQVPDGKCHFIIPQPDPTVKQFIQKSASLPPHSLLALNLLPKLKDIWIIRTNSTKNCLR
jgi:hypothetical protein